MTRKEEIDKEANSFANTVSVGEQETAKNWSAFISGAEWADKSAWKPADGDNLPEIGREVIALVEENGRYKVVFAHRPPEYWDGRNILTNKVTRNYTKRYDKGEWNQPNVKWWLDLELPKMEE